MLASSGLPWKRETQVQKYSFVVFPIYFAVIFFTYPLIAHTFAPSCSLSGSFSVVVLYSVVVSLL